jgi:hypothetical protein
VFIGLSRKDTNKSFSKMKFLPTLLLFILPVSCLPVLFQLHRLDFFERTLGRLLPFFYPSEVNFVIRDPSPRNSGFVDTKSDLENVAFGHEYMAKLCGLKPFELVITNWDKGIDNVIHVHFSRNLNGINVTNHNAAVHIFQGEVIAESMSFKPSEYSRFLVSPTTVKVPLEQSVQAAVAQFGLPRDNTTARLAYVEIPGKKLVCAHVFQLYDIRKSGWLQIHSDIATGYHSLIQDKWYMLLIT